MIVSVIGIDPGETVGIAFLDYFKLPLSDSWHPVPEPLIMQCEHRHAARVLESLLKGRADLPVVRRFAGVERFVEGRSAGTRGKPAGVTRQLVMELTECCQLYGYAVQLRSAADVKPWATDKRLIKAGIAKEGQMHGKLRDGFDGGRHGLYCAVWDAKMTDPLA